MTTQITIVSPNDTDKAVGVTVQQFGMDAGVRDVLAWYDVKPTVVLQPGASMSEYIHRTQRVVIGELELLAESANAPALDAVAEGAEPNPAPEAVPGDNLVPQGTPDTGRVTSFDGENAAAAGDTEGAR